MPDNFMPTSAEYFRVLPEIILTLAGVLIMFLEAVLKDRSEGHLRAALDRSAWLAALVGAIVANGDPGPAFHEHADRRRLRHVLPRPGDRRRHARRAQLPPNICAARNPRAANSTR